MRAWLLVCALCVFHANWSIAQYSVAADLDRLVANKQYPELERELGHAGLSDADLTYYTGILSNHLNQPSKSVDLIESVLPTLESSNSLRAEYAVCTLADDFVKLSQYQKAVETYALAAHIAYAQFRTSVCQADRKASRWALFMDAPPQSVVAAGSTTVHAQRDKMGLFEVPITAGNYTGAWLLDTGANVTVIRRSVAAQIGIQISASAATAQGISGKQVGVRAGVIPELHLGSAIVRNVPVLVVEDTDLDFASMNFEIDGSLGLPVLAALGKLTMHADGTLILGPANSQRANIATHNFFLEGSTPLIAADLGEGQQLFVMDSGSQGVILSADFYAQAKQTSNSGRMITLDLAGAGGVGSIPAIGPLTLAANFADLCVRLSNVHILTGDTGSGDDFYGVIGQSALQEFASVTLDFQNMQFSVSGASEGCNTTALAAGAH
jgi:predicted aspartyl protease